MRNLKVKLICLLMLLGNAKMGWANEINDVQMQYVLKQFSKVIQTGSVNEMRLLLSDEFVLGNQRGLSAKAMLSKVYENMARPVAIEFEKFNTANNDVLVNASLANGKKLSFGLRLNNYYEFEKIGLFDQSLGLVDPVINANQKLKLVKQVPLNKIKDKLYLSLSVENSSELLNFMFDTGAGATVIDSAKAIAIGLNSKNDDLDVTTSSGKKVEFKKLDQRIYNIGSVKIRSSSTLLGNLEQFTKVAGVKVDGIIGYDLLKDYVVELDNDRMILNIYSGGTMALKKGYDLPLELYKNTPVVSLSFTNNSKVYKGEFMYDTGLNDALFLNAAGKYRSNEIIGPQTDQKIANLDVAGNYQEKYTKKIDEVEMGGEKFENITISTASNNNSEWTAIDGLIGMELIQKFNTYFDYPNHRIVLIKNKK